MLIFLPVIALMLPIFDRVYMGLWRLSHGRREGDTPHLRSLLLDLGVTERWLVFFIWLTILQAGVIANVLYDLRSLPLTLVVAITEPLAGLFLIVCLIRIGEKMERKRDPGKVRILFLSHYYFPEVNAPASRLYEHTQHWTAAGHEVTVICPVPSAPHGRPYPGFANAFWSEENVAGARVIRVWTFVAANRGKIRRTLNYISYMFSALFALIFLRRHDVLVATSPQFFCGIAGAVASKFRREKFVLEVRDLWPESIEAVGAGQPGILLRLVASLAGWMYRRADAIVTVGEGYREKLVEQARLNPSRIHVIPNGVDPSWLRQDIDNPAGEGAFTVSYVGTLGLAHGLDVVLRAAEILRDRLDIHFVLAGDGAEHDRLEREARHLGLSNVRFTGLLDKEGARRVLRESDACLVHLKNKPLFQSVLPSKLFEAMAMARPVLMGVGGHAGELVRAAGAGLAFTPEDGEDLARCVTELAGNPEQCRAMGTRGRAYVSENYTRERFAGDYVALLKMVRDETTTSSDDPDGAAPATVEQPIMETPPC